MVAAMVLAAGSSSGWLTAMTIPLVLFAVAVAFGGGALLFVGARFAAKIPGATYWRAVGAQVLSLLACGAIVAIFAIVATRNAAGADTWVAPFAFLGGLLLGLPGGILVTWLVIKAVFRTTFGKAALAWLPTLGQAVFVIPLLVALLMPGLSRARELARRAACKSNVLQIAVGLTVYASANRDLWPPDLTYLVKDGRPPGIFVCPSTINTPGSGHFDYFYLPADSNADPGALVLCDFRTNHGDGHRSILFADLHAGEVDTNAEFQALLADPNNAAFAKALRTKENP